MHMALLSFCFLFLSPLSRTLHFIFRSISIVFLGATMRLLVCATPLLTPPYQSAMIWKIGNSLLLLETMRQKGFIQRLHFYCSIFEEIYLKIDHIRNVLIPWFDFCEKHLHSPVSVRQWKNVVALMCHCYTRSYHYCRCVFTFVW